MSVSSGQCFQVWLSTSTYVILVRYSTSAVTVRRSFSLHPQEFQCPRLLSLEATTPLPCSLYFPYVVEAIQSCRRRCRHRRRHHRRHGRRCRYWFDCRHYRVRRCWRRRRSVKVSCLRCAALFCYYRAYAVLYDSIRNANDRRRIMPLSVVSANVSSTGWSRKRDKGIQIR